MAYEYLWQVLRGTVETSLPNTTVLILVGVLSIVAIFVLGILSLKIGVKYLKGSHNETRKVLGTMLLCGFLAIIALIGLWVGSANLAVFFLILDFIIAPFIIGGRHEVSYLRGLGVWVLFMIVMVSILFAVSLMLFGNYLKIFQFVQSL